MGGPVGKSGAIAQQLKSAVHANGARATIRLGGLMRTICLPLLLAALQGSALVPATAQAPAIQENLGAHHYAVNASPKAQQYFDQGLRLLWGFNHAEAIRSFRE